MVGLVTDSLSPLAKNMLAEPRQSLMTQAHCFSRKFRLTLYSHYLGYLFVVCKGR
jgi:hypothetical protein